MNYADVKGLSDKDLLKKSKELRTEMFQARMKNALGQLANPMTIRNLRRDVARLKTAATAKVNAASAKAAAPKAKPAAKKAGSNGK
ncbi:MAG: 50S ribosomal protein L29, partial [Bdellovibrionota bacterium]